MIMRSFLITARYHDPIRCLQKIKYPFGDYTGRLSSFITVYSLNAAVSKTKQQRSI